MNLQSVRLGRATNSSSSHSVIILPEGHRYTDDENDIEIPHNFGREDFLLVSRDAKVRYFVAQLYRSIFHAFVGDEKLIYADDDASQARLRDSQDKTLTVLRQLLGDDLLDVANDPDDTRVDHQSCWSWPCRYGTYDIDMEFVTEMKGYYLNRPGLAVHGGNDDGGVSQYSDAGSSDEIASTLGSYGTMISRKDGEYWTLFNRDSGAKIRFSFSTGEPFVAANTPELVDVKVTDYCRHGCRWCYQGSTPKGEHSKSVYSVLDALASMKVFEVAFGGGEPTAHPDFPNILRYAHKRGMSVAFTTFDNSWLDNEDLVQAVYDTRAAFALSVNGRKELPKIAEVMLRVAETKINYSSPAVIQTVVGSCPEDELIEISVEADRLHKLWFQEKYQTKTHPTRNWICPSICLLGWKNVGRAPKVNPHRVDMNNVLLRIKEKSHSVSVDTAFVAQFKEELSDVPSFLKVAREGTFSCYIDAVEGIVAKDSYSGHEGVRVDPYDAAALEQAVRSTFPFCSLKTIDPDRLVPLVKSAANAPSAGLNLVIADLFEEAADDDTAYRLRLPGEFVRVDNRLVWRLSEVQDVDWKKCRDVMLPVTLDA